MAIQGKYNWLVTGGAGFIGSHIAHLLVENGQNVFVFDNLSTGNLANLDDIKDKITFIQGSTTNKADIAKLPKSIDYIFRYLFKVVIRCC